MASASLSSRLPDNLWHLAGAGSMGSLAAWRLQQAGMTVRVIRPTALSLQRTLHWPDGRQVSLSLPSAGDEPIARLLVAVKAGDTHDAVTPLLPRLGASASVLRLQNGMGSFDGVALPASARLFHLVTTDGAWRQGEQIHVVAENQTLIGDGSPLPPPWFAELAPYWPGLRWCEQIERAQWAKLAINAVINPLTAGYHCRNGELLDGAGREQQMAALAAEVDAVLGQMFADWPGDTLARSREVAQQTAANTSSMLADVLAARSTEIAFINGYLLRRADALGIDLPAHRQWLTRIGEMPKVAAP
ncbi:MAG: ketopantoate reductase family protein [Alcanivoracaceae bacterium]